MELGIFIFFVVVGIGLIASVIMSGSFGRDTLENADKVEKDAVVVDIEPKYFGNNRDGHYEAVIRFSDGSSYRGKASTYASTGLPNRMAVRFSKEQAVKVLESALEAHEQAVKNKYGEG